MNSFSLSIKASTTSGSKCDPELVLIYSSVSFFDQVPDNGAADHAGSTCNENFVRFIHYGYVKYILLPSSAWEQLVSKTSFRFLFAKWNFAYRMFPNRV